MTKMITQTVKMTKIRHHQNQKFNIFSNFKQIFIQNK